MVWRMWFRAMFAPVCTYTSDSQSHLPENQLLYLNPLNTQLRWFFPCVTTGKKGGVPFLSILSSGYVPASPHDANFHPYNDIFCRAVFSWCNFGDEQMAIGLWRCYWIVTAGNKVPAEHSTVWLPYSKLSYQHWQLWVHIFLLIKWSHLTQRPGNTVGLGWYVTAFIATNHRRNVICYNFF